jgi:sterol desaturase/sphingolipid hydroxylase (fatty acid hydroxylase superfamily)
MPPFVSVILATLLFFSFRAIFGAVYVEPYFAGFLIGYLCYDYIHFSVHHFTPKTKLGKLLKQSHMHHHFITPNARWGVSSPFWDYVFGTLEERTVTKSRAKSVRHGS